MSFDELGSSRAKLEPYGDGLLLASTVASLNLTSGFNDLYEAAAMIELKCKSKQATMEEFTGEEQPYNVTVTCQQVNQVTTFG